MKKVKIIFDNNKSIVGPDRPVEDIFSNSVYKLREFTIKNKIEDRVSITLTEVFKQEGVAELQSRVVSKYENVLKNSQLLQGIIGKKITEDVDKNELRGKVSKRFAEKIKELNIEILGLPTETQVSELVSRAIEYVPPFEKGDKGFKDSIAWLAILEDAKINQDNSYVLVSVDNIFNDSRLKEEFLSVNKNGIIVIPPEPVEEELDNLLALGIGLEAIGKEATEYLRTDNPFKRELERITLEELNQSNHRGNTWWTASAVSLQLYSPYGTDDWKKKVINVFFRNASVNVKNKINKDTFEVEAVINFNLKYSDSNTDSGNKQDLSWVHPVRVTDYAPSVVSLMAGGGYGSYETPGPEYLEKRFNLSFDKKNGFKLLE